MNAQPATGPPATASSVKPAPSTVSLRDLNQRSGRIVAGVVDSGRSVTITDRGRPVAQIVPIKRDETPLERLTREGRVTEPSHPFRIPSRRITLPEGVTIQQILDEDREEIDLDALR